MYHFVTFSLGSFTSKVFCLRFIQFIQFYAVPELDQKRYQYPNLAVAKPAPASLLVLSPLEIMNLCAQKMQHLNGP